MTSVLPIYRETPPNRRAVAAERIHADFAELVAAGFTRAEALRIIIAILKT
jgi:hypothetical protein